MDERLAETMLLLPENSFEKGLITGISDAKVIESLGERIRHIEMADAQGLGHVEKDSFDIVFSFFGATPDLRTVGRVLDAVRSGGTAIVVMPSGCSNLSKISKAFPDSQVYGLSPSLEDLRLAVPLSSRVCTAASLALYQPSLAKARLRRAIAYCLARLGLVMVWARWLMLVWRKEAVDTGKGLPSAFRERFGEDVKLALFTGTPGYLRKPTIQIMDGYGAILGYCKVAGNPQTKAVVKNEARVLERLANFDLGTATVPKLIFSGAQPDGTIVLVQSTRKKHFSSAPLTPGDIHSDFLARIFAETRTLQKFKESSAYREVADRLPSVKEHMDEECARNLSAALEWTSEVVESEKVPLCLAHRDFTPWNTFLAGRNLYVFDWEFARFGWTPLVDAFHFVLQKGILVDHAEEDVLWRKVTEDREQEGRFLKKYAVSVGIEGAAYYGLLAFYLTDMVTTYLVHYREAGCDTMDGQELIRRWTGMLKRLMKARGRLSA